ncbi:MAG: hypothetical protein IKC89_01240 [Lentisphaeria bacterium]|nr:hypothetical protein [Lentisphaeria bacterium]
MSFSTKNMLYLADLYFTDGNDNFRFQWTTDAWVSELPVHPGVPEDHDDNNEYYQKLAKYTYMQDHLDDNSSTAASFKVSIYAKKSGKLVASKNVTSCEAEFHLANGEYLWEVTALDANGNVITTSEKSYFVNPDFDDFDDEDAQTSYRTSSRNHKVAYIETTYEHGVKTSEIGKIITGGKDAYFSVCGPHSGNENTWECAQEGGYAFSVSAAFGGFDGEFYLGKNILSTCGGIYEYENGKWNYKLFTEPWMLTSEANPDTDYLYWGNTIYKWDCAGDKLIVVRETDKEVYYISDHYYINADGVFSIATGKQVLAYNISIGECPLFNDMLVHSFARNAEGEMVEVLEAGEAGSVAVQYFFFDSKTGKVSSQEVTIWSGVAGIRLDSNEFFDSRIGNCLCFKLQDESDDITDPRATIVIHEITSGNIIKTYTKVIESVEDVEFTTDAKGRLVCYYEDADRIDQEYLPGIEVDFNTPVTSDITLISNVTTSDDGNNWSDMKTAGSAGAVGKLGTITAPGEVVSGKAGKDDEFDYFEFTLESAAKLSFDISSDDAAKFVIYSLNEKNSQGVTTYSLKSRQSTTLKKAKGAVDYTALTKGLLLDAGTYYIGVQSTNAKKGGDADYTISVNADTVFYTGGDNSDDWNDVKTAGANGSVGKNVTINADTAEILSDWVGYGDTWDHISITLEDAAKLSFDITSGDAAKFVIYSLNEKTSKGGVTTYSLKSRQSTTLKKAKGADDYTALTKGLLLDAGTYYIGVQSTNAKKGGNADYTISVNAGTLFYTRGDDGSNDWLYDKKVKVFNTEIEDIGSIGAGDGLLLDGEACWVGYGDEFDYYKFSVGKDMDAAFHVAATDAVKVVIYQIVNGKVKTLQTTAVKAGTSISTKKLALSSDGEYYISIQSTNAKKGGDAGYSISANEFITPLKMTLLNVTHSTVDAWQDKWDDKYEGNYDKDWWISEDKYVHSKFKAGNKLNEEIVGTDGDDVITCAAGRYSGVGRGIFLGNGNDKIILESHSIETHLYLYGEDGDYFDGTIDMGAGNDSIIVGKNGDLESAYILMGDSNDLLQINANADGIEDTQLLDFGNGDDKFIIEGAIVEDLKIFEVNMGAGNDTFEVKHKNSENSYFGYINFGDGNDEFSINNFECGNIDFGDGHDTLNMNGTLIADTISGLEKVTGSGTWAFTETPDEATLEVFKAAGIDLICSGRGFTSREEELKDNTRAGAATFDTGSDDAHFYIWLSSQEYADSIGEYGFADTVDWVKADTRKLDSDETLKIGYIPETVTMTMYTPDGKAEVFSDTYFELDEWKRGVYYFKFEISSGACSITMDIDD